MIQPKDPNKRKKLHDYLVENKMTKLSFDEFSSEYGNKNDKFTKLYTYLQNNEMTKLTPSEFKNEYFGDVKKKDVSVSKTQQTEQVSSSDSKVATISLGEEDLQTDVNTSQPVDLSTLRDYNNWREATKLTEDDLKQINQTIQKELNPDTFDRIGRVYNSFADTFNNVFSNTQAGVGGLLGDDLEVLPKDTNAFNYLKDELNQAEEEIRDLYDGKKPDNYTDLLKSRAIEIKTQKLKDGVISFKRRQFLNELPVEKREKLFDYAENSLINENEELSDVSQAINLLESETKSKMELINEELSPLVKRMQQIQGLAFSDEEWAATEDERIRLKSEYEDISNTINERLNQASESGISVKIQDGKISMRVSEEYQQEYNNLIEKQRNTNANISNYKDEIDLFNRSYNMFSTALTKGGAMTLDIIGGLADVQLMYEKEILEPIAGDIPVINGFLKFRQEATEKVGDKLNEWADDMREGVQKSFSVSEAEGFDDWMTYVLTTTSETAPYIVAAASNPQIGATTIIGSGTGSKYREIQREIEEGAEYNKAQILTSSLVAGASEYVLSANPTAKRLKGFGRVAKSVPKDIYEGAIKKTFKKMKKYSTVSLKEGFEETGTVMIQNFSDNVVLGKKDVGIYDNITDPFVAGSMVGFMLPFAGAVSGYASRSITNSKERKKLKDNSDRLMDLESKMAEDKISDDTYDVIKNEYLELIKQNRDIILSNAENLKKATKDEFSELKRIDKDLVSLKKKAKEVRSNVELDVDSKKLALNKLKSQAEKDIKTKADILKTLKERDVAPEEIKVDDDKTTDTEDSKTEVVYAERNIGEGESVFLEITDGVKKVISKNSIPENVDVIPEIEIKVTPETKPKDFEAVKEKEGSDKIKKINKLKKKASKAFKKNRGGRFIADNGSLLRSLKVNPELLNENELQEFEQYVNDVNNVRFSQEKSKETINKFAEIYDNQPKVNETATETEKKELDPELISEFGSVQKFKTTNVRRDLSDYVSLIKSITPEELSNFSDNDVKILSTNISDYANGGLLNKKSYDILNKIKSSRNEKNLLSENVSKKFRILLRDSFDKFFDKEFAKGENIKDRYSKYISRTPFRDLDNILKGKKGDEMFRFMGINNLASTYSSYETSLKTGVFAKVGDVFGKITGRRSRLKANAAVYLYRLQKSYNLNTKSEKIFSPYQYMQASNSYAKSSKDLDYQDQMEVVNEVFKNMPKMDNGTDIDLEKAFESLSDKEKALIDITEKYDQQEGLEMSKITANMEGKTPEIYDYYIHINSKTNERVDIGEAMNEAKHFRESGTYVGEVGSLIERQNKVQPLNFNYVQKFRTNVSKLSRKYYMYPALMEFNSTFNRLLNNENIEPNFKNLVQAVRENVAYVHDNAFASSYYNNGSIGVKISDWFREAGYFNQLASGVRASVELLSNMLMALGNTPKQTIKGLRILSSRDKKLSIENLEYLFNLAGSTQTTRLFIDANSIMVEQQSGVNISDDTVTGIKKTLKRAQTATNEYLLSRPDRIVSRPVAVGSLFSRYEELSGGKSIDVERLKTDDDYYMSIKDNLEEAMIFADEKLSQTSSSFNPFESAAFSQLSFEDRGRILPMFDKYLTRFQLAEHSSVVKSIDALKGDRKDLDKWDGGRLLAFTLARMGAYNVGMQFGAVTLTDTVMGLLGYQNKYDDDDERNVSQIIYNETMSVLANVFIMRRLGNLGKIAMSTGIESLNVKYGETVGLRDSGDYNFRDSLTYSLLNRDEQGNIKWDTFTLLNNATKLLGPYSILTKDVLKFANTVDKAGFFGLTEGRSSRYDTRKKYEKKQLEEATKLLLSLIKLPAPKDVRRLLNYEVAKDIGSKSSSDTKIRLDRLKGENDIKLNTDLFKTKEEIDDLFKNP